MQKQRQSRQTSAQMYAHIRSWEQSGMSQKDYIFTHGLSKSLFGYWLRKYRQSCMTEGGFVEVSAQPDVDIRRKDAIFARLESADGHQLLLYESVSATYLRDLMGW